MRSIAILLPILYLLIAPARQQGCLNVLQAPSDNEELETGSFSLSSEGKSGRYVSYNVTLQKNRFAAGFQVSLSIIYIKNYNDPHGVDFTITSTINGGGFIAGLFISEDAVWTICHSHYIASNLDNLRTGYFPVESTELLRYSNTSNGNNTILATYYFGNKRTWSPSTKFVSVHVFLNGIRTQDPDFDISIDMKETTYSIADNSITVLLRVSNIQKPIESVIISYILYSTNGGIKVSRALNYLDAVIQTLENPVFSKQYIFSGMTGVKGSELQRLRQASKGRLLAQQILASGNKQIIEIFTKAFEINSINIFNSDANENILTLVPANLQNLVRMGVCINYQTCVNNGGSFETLKNGNTACVACGKNQVFNWTSQICQCAPSFYLSNGICKTEEQLCGSKNLFVDGVCYRLVVISEVCKENQVYNNSTRRCECVNGFQQTVSAAGQIFCLPSCKFPATYSFSTLKCECPANFQFKNNGCVECTSLEVYSSATKECKCAPGIFTSNSGICILCPQNSAYSSRTDKCECNPGYQGTFCRKIPGTVATPTSNLQISNTPANPQQLSFSI